MKFGQNFHLLQVPEWEPFYINYGLLKKLFSTVANKNSHLTAQPNFTELYACLSCNTDALNTFRNDKYEFLHRKETEFCKRYGIELHLSAIPALEEVDDHELKDLLEAFTELRQDLAKLQWYDRVNQDAIHRIYTKLEKFSKTIEPSHHDHKSKWINLQLDWETQCMKHVARLNKTVADISLASSKSQFDSMRRSLYLENICDLQSPVLVYPSAEYHAIRDDQPSTLVKLLEQKILNNESPISHLQALLSGLLEFSMTCQSRRCTNILLLWKLSNNGDAIYHNCLNHLIAITGRNNMPADCNDLVCRAQGLSDQSDSESGTSHLLQMLEQLRPSERGVLQVGDVFGRLPLHYAARYGLTSICQSILDSLQDLEDSSAAREAVLSTDSEGYTPLYFAVIRNHAAVTRLFLETLEMDHQTGDEARDEHLRSVLGGLLHPALKSQYNDMVHLLVSSHIDINHRSSRGETALYVAAQIGREDYVEILLKAASDKNAIDICETVNGWTPLFIACAKGHLAVVKLLLQAGASQTILDHRGWTAKEHAAFRGHLAVAGMLESCHTGDPSGGPASTPFKTVVGANNHFRADNSHIIVNLGVMQNGKQVTAVDLNCCSSEFTQSLHTGARFSIEVSVPGGSGPNRLVQLPISSDMINEPFVFPIKNPSEAQLVFNIFRASPAHGTKGVLVGSGTALLESRNHYFGAQRESLVREHTVPILERQTLDFMGTVTFTFVIAKPYLHLDTPPANRPIKEADQIQLVGHRGLGQNTASRTHLQLGENTIESFLSAAKLGASFVEFDVQLTRDLVPVIYHDFSLSESGTDIPIQDLSLDQFMHASNVQSPRGNPASALGGSVLQAARAETGRAKPRSRSVTRDAERGAEEVQDRMKHTVDFMSKGFKPNTRGDSIQGSFTTLEELLVALPESIGFNIEMKYPRLHEAADAGVAPVAIELNTFLDAALAPIFRLGGARAIILSSFTPEVCMLLATKQRAYPVMFISNAGKQPAADMEMRTGSLQAAVRFARRWGLAGVVFAAEALLLCPRLVGYVKSAGLVCASYGVVNNVPGNAKAQADAGLDIIMADRVGLIAESLKLHSFS